jgi:outer membrane receptor for ferrienterochelin and colicins
MLLHTFAASRRLSPSVGVLTAFAVSHAAFAQEPVAEPAANASTNTSIAPLVVTAAGFEQKLTDAPASISVITREDLSRRPYMTLLDAVRDLEGVDVGETRDKTGQGSISIRGMGSDYTLILIDGRRQNNHGDIYPNNFGGNQFNHIPPLDAIERIEVIRGPASTLYGADAMGGVINVITRKDAQKWSGSTTLGRTTQEDSEFGDDTTVDAYFSGPIIRGVLNASLRGSWYDREASNPTYAPLIYPNGETRIRSVGFGGGGKTVDNTNTVFGGGLTWTPTQRQTMTLDFDTSFQEYDNKITLDDAGNLVYPVGTVDNIDSVFSAGNFCLGATGNNMAACEANGGTFQRRANPRVGYSPSQEFTRDAWSVTHRGTWDFGNSFVSLSHIATNNDGRTLPFTVAERDRLLEMVDGTGEFADLTEQARRDIAEATFLPRPKRTLESSQMVVDAQLDIPFQLSGEHMLIVGGQVIRGELEDGVFGLESGAPGQVQDHNLWSVFAEDTWYVITPLAITAGLRHDDHQEFGSHLSPRLYGVYTVNPQWTAKGGVSTGFKTPKTTDLYDGITGFGGQGTSPFFGNPNLQPETSVSTEAAIYWQHPVNNHSANLTIFRNEFEDKIASQPCGPGTNLPCANTGEFADLGYASSSRSTNIDKVVLEGAEIAGRYQILNSLGLRANYTFTDSEQKSGAEAGLPLNNTAKHMANATLDWQALAKLNVFLSIEARSDRYRGQSAEDNRTLFFKDYEILHLGASYQLLENVTLNGRVNNLLDEDFTTYDTTFVSCSDTASTCVYDAAGLAGFEATSQDHYNNIDKRRNFWLSVNMYF